jgi:hypothetical protein
MRLALLIPCRSRFSGRVSGARRLYFHLYYQVEQVVSTRGRACSGHPRLPFGVGRLKAWMPGTSPGKGFCGYRGAEPATAKSRRAVAPFARFKWGSEIPC